MALTEKFNKGMYVDYNNEPCLILERDFYKPGKGNALNRLKMRNVKNGKILNLTIKSGERLDELDVQTKTVMFSYNDDKFAYFMDPVSYEQYTLLLDMIPGRTDWLYGEGKYIAIFHDEEIISMQVPPKLTLAVTETAPATRGNTATNAFKEATLETGVMVMVPLFVDVGDKIIVNSETGDYYSKEN